MANNRFTNLNQEKKEMLMAVAIKEFSEFGFKGSSINRISKAANVSRGHLYYYFDNKEDLYKTVVEYVFRKFETSKLENNKSFWKDVETNVRLRVKLTAENPVIGDFINRFYFTENTVMEKDIEYFSVKKVQDELRKIFDEGIKRGEIRNDLPLDFLFNIHLSLVLTVNKWLSNHLDDMSNDVESERFITEAIQMIKAALAPKGDQI